MSQLGAAIGSRPTTLTSVLDRLERRGHITRGVKAGDRRSVLIELTPSERPQARPSRPACATSRHALRGPVRAHHRRLPRGRRPDGGRVMVTFEQLMAEVTRGGRFGHRQHVELTWLAVRAFGTTPPSLGERRHPDHGALRRGAAEVPRHDEPGLGRAGRPPRERGRHGPTSTPSPSTTRCCWTSGCCNGSTARRPWRAPTARTGWVEPDLAPFPWLATSARVGTRCC